jgi:hypothetical protein
MEIISSVEKIAKIVKESFYCLFIKYFLQMSDNHHIDIVVVKTKNESPPKLEINETNFSLNANLGKLESVSFSEDILTFQFGKGHLRIDMSIEDICKYLNFKQKKGVN